MSHLTEELLQSLSPSAEQQKMPSCSTRRTLTLRVHSAGKNEGYVNYGRARLRELEGNESDQPLKKVKLQPFASPMAFDKTRHVGEILRSESPSSSPLTFVLEFPHDLPPSPRPSSDFEESAVEEELHRESTVLVERRMDRQGKRWVFKKYLHDNADEGQIVPMHSSRQDQLAYEVCLYLKELKNVPKMIQLEAFFHEEGVLTMVFPDLGVNRYPSDASAIQSYMKQLLEALSFLWQLGIVHCNIKGGSKPNAIFDHCGKLTMIDFETSVRRHDLIDQGAESIWFPDPTVPYYRGNPYYLAPELLERQSGRNEYGNTAFGRRRDIYSAGVLMVELLLNKHDHIFTYGDWDPSSEELLQARKQLQHQISFLGSAAALRCYGSFVADNHAFNESGADLAAKMLTWDRFARISPIQAAQNEFCLVAW